MIFAGFAALLGGIFGLSKTKYGQTNAAANDLIGNVRGLTYTPPSDIKGLLQTYPAKAPPAPLPKLSGLSNTFAGYADPFSLSNVVGGKIVSVPLTPTGSQGGTGGFTGALSAKEAYAAARAGNMGFLQQPISRYFFWSDVFLNYGSRRDSVIKAAPWSVFENAARHAKNIDKVRENLKKPMKVSSWYRDLTKNRSIGSGDKSRHVQGDATDFEGDKAFQLQILAAARRVGWKGGIGRPDRIAICHLDSRPGANVEWVY
jgi:hypothetical protein